MSLQFTKEDMRRARRTELASYLESNHPASVKKEGMHYLRFKDNQSINIRRGNCSYKDYQSGETGNSVDFLVNYMGYSIPEAVHALIGSTAQFLPKSGESNSLYFPQNGDRNTILSEEPYKEINIPEKADSYRNVYAYLIKTRGIDYSIVNMLVKNDLLYQQKKYNNAVFISSDQDFYELRGTLSDAAPFHGVDKTRSDRSWFFSGNNKPDKIYVCEGAIDAISLYQLKRDENAMYASIAGVMNKKAISRLKSFGIPVILAVDNDEGGQRCRDSNSELEYILPVNKDWNVDLCYEREFSSPSR